jgi:hypothetical protein
MTKQDGGAAFPGRKLVGKRVQYDDERGENVTIDEYADVSGMTLRDFFVASIGDDLDGADIALEIKEAVLGRSAPKWKTDPVGFMQFEAEFRAKWRGMRADAMLAEREKGAQG